MDRRILLVAPVLVLLIAGVSGIGAAEEPMDRENNSIRTVEGTSLTVGEQEDEYLDRMREITSSTGYENRDHAFLLIRDGDRFVVFTDTEPTTGSATVYGDVVAEASDDTTGIIFANDATFQTEGQQADLSDIQSNPGAYEWEHIRVSGHYRQLAYTVDAADQTEQNIIGAISEQDNRIAPSLTESPGQQARWSVVNLSNDEYGESRNGELASQMFSRESDVPGVSFDTDFWMDAEVHLDAIVVPEGDSASLVIVDATPQATRINGPDQINNRGEELTGEVVQFETQIVGSRTSSKEFLTTVAPCGGSESVFVGVTPPGCIPVVTDTTLHSGVAFTGTPESLDDIVPYTGISNYHQDVVTQAETGTYEVTGRVVAASEIDPSLEGEYALVVYDMNRQGDLRVRGEARNTVEAHASVVTDQMEEQMNSSQQDWESNQQRAGTQNSDSNGDSSISIVNAEYTQNPIEPHGTGAVVVTIENTGSASGSISIEWRGPSWTIREQTVEVEAGERREITLQHQFDRGEGSLRTYVNSEDLGMLQFESTSERQTTANTDQANSDDHQVAGPNNDNNLPITHGDPGLPSFVLFGVGLAALLLSVLLDVMLTVKRRKHARDFNTRQNQVENLFAVGLIPLILGGILLGGIISIIAGITAIVAFGWGLVVVLKAVYNAL